MFRPAFAGAFLSSDLKDALWAKFYTGAPQRQRQSVERYNIVMSGRRSQIKGSLPWREVRGCGHVSGLLVRDEARWP